jgi:NADH-quinone oxidoreductase subunit L
MDTTILISSIILFLPLVAFIVQIHIGRFFKREGDWLPTSAVGIGLLLSLYLFATMLGTHPTEHGAGLKPVMQEWEWIRAGSGLGLLDIRFGIYVDNLTVVMLVVVTLVSFLVHVYSMGYMHGEERYNRFFAYLGLFTFSMLGLVLSSNLLFVYIFWELVGVCSYLLIGFYIHKDSAAAAAKKAFITNRVGDLGFLIGILITVGVAGSTMFSDVFASVATGMWDNKTIHLTSGLSVSLLTFAGLLMFMGPMGKSAQFPLHVWLPDAMEGPTPVSALIHAATMVAAGVYLVGRMFPFFTGPGFFQGNFFDSPVLLSIALIGGFTAIMAATIAVAQTDIKKVLAYSTVSQLGFMMIGCGVGTFAFALFHLFTHAFFKACLFLGAGSVIHAIHSQEMCDMGGLRKKMPVTYWTFLISTCAIAGVPFLSGFYSKEGILTQALAYAFYHGHSPQWFVYALPFIFGICAAAFTAFYMFRIIWLTFHGHPRDEHKYEHAHESHFAMAMPLVVLSFLAIVSAGILPGILTGKAKSDAHEAKAAHAVSEFWFVNYISPAALVESMPAGYEWVGGKLQPRTAKEQNFLKIQESKAVAEMHHCHTQAHLPTLLASIFVASLGIFLSWLCFLGPWHSKNLVRGPLKAYHKVLVNLYYIDWFYLKTVVALTYLASKICGWFDHTVVDFLVNMWGWITVRTSDVAGKVDYYGVDGTVRMTGAVTLKLGQKSVKIQTGRVQDYIALSLMLVVLVLFVFMLLV